MNLLWSFAFRNLLRHKRRSLSTGIAIVIGFSSLSLLGAYILRAHYARKAQTVYINLQGSLQVYKHEGLQNFSVLPKKYIIDSELDKKLTKEIDQIRDKVDFESRFLSGSGLLISNGISQPFLAVGFEKNIYSKAIGNPQVQRWAQDWVSKTSSEVDEARLRQQDIISITPRIARVLRQSTDVSINTGRDVQLLTRTFSGDLNAADARVGLFHTTGIAFADDNSIQVSLSLLQDLLGTEGYQYRSIFLKTGVDETQVQKYLREAFLDRNLPLDVYTFKAEGIGDVYNGVMGFLYVIGCFFFILILVIVVLSIVNTLTLGILERTKELGSLKALGFSRSQIVQLFVRETVWLSGLSIGFGFILSQVIARIVNFANIRFSPPGVEGTMQFFLAPEVSMYFLLMIVLFLVATLTAYFVSSRKMRLTPIQLLTDAGV